MAYGNCDVCGCNVLIPWSSLESNQAEYNLQPGVVICTEECYHEAMQAESDHRFDMMTNR